MLSEGILSVWADQYNALQTLHPPLYTVRIMAPSSLWACILYGVWEGQNYLLLAMFVSEILLRVTEGVNNFNKA